MWNEWVAGFEHDESERSFDSLVVNGKVFLAGACCGCLILMFWSASGLVDPLMETSSEQSDDGSNTTNPSS